MKKLHTELRGVNTQDVEKKRKSKKISSVSSDQRFARGLEKTKMELDKYEATDRIAEWNINFNVGEDYNEKNFESVEASHEKLLHSEKSTLYIKLLINVERERMYDHLKYSDKYGTWSIICRRLGIDDSQAKSIHLFI